MWKNRKILNVLGSRQPRAYFLELFFFFEDFFLLFEAFLSFDFLAFLAFFGFSEDEGLGSSAPSFCCCTASAGMNTLPYFWLYRAQAASAWLIVSHVWPSK